MTKKLSKIIVVGGGTAGFVAALIMRTRFPHLEIQMIRSSKIGIIGVGEGSTEHWKEFMDYIGVDWKTVITQCDATFKSGIMFRGWGDQDYLHSTTAEFDQFKNGQYLYLYGRQIAYQQPKKLMNPQRTWENKVFLHHLEGPESPFNQYHFNTQKLNDFLTKIAELKNIKIIDDEILDLELDENGDISFLQGEKTKYDADFFFDSTGFRRILISKLGAKWQSYGNYLKMKSAIVFPTGDEDEYPAWTVSQAMDYGWMFRIPVWGRKGNGYIFDSDFIDADKAKQEVEKFLGHEINIGKQINFDPGALDKVWIKNCCAVGISANFVEPLEATSIGTSIQQIFLLMHRLPNYTEETIDRYNQDVAEILLNIRDFVILHYITKKENTEFWKYLKTVEIPDTLKSNLERWKNNLPIEDDFHNQTKYCLFRENHYIHILNGLDLFEAEKLKEEYLMMHPKIRENAEDAIREILTVDKITPSIGHKEFISRVRGQNKV